MKPDPKDYDAIYRKPGQFAGPTSADARKVGPAITAVTQHKSEPDEYLGGLVELWTG